MTPSRQRPMARSFSPAARLLLGALAVCSLSGGLLPHRAGATPRVTSLADPGNGGCTPAECTLREAITDAQDGDILTFEPALFTTGPKTLRLRAGALRIDKTLTLVGPGQALLAISGHRASAVLTIAPGTVVVLSHVTITQGLAVPVGGIDNAGTLTLASSTVSHHTGSALFNRATGTLILQHSTVSNTTFNGLVNEGTAILAQSTVRANATGIRNDGSGLLTMHHSTVSSNTVTGLFNRGTASLAQSTVSANGTGLFNDGSGLMTLRQSTVSGNTVTGLFNNGTLTRHNALIAGNGDAQPPDADCAGSGTLRNDGFTLTGRGTGCASDASRGDLTVHPARVFTHVLKRLRHNGGPTMTHALWPHSPALDAGDPAACQGTDQRGVARPQGRECDMGAFEREQP